MRLMHGVEKQELMHHFLGRAGRAGSRPTCRRPTNPRVVVPRDEGTRVREERSTTPNLPEAHPPPKTWCPATKEQGFAGSEAPRSTCRRPSAPKDVVPRDEGTRVRGELSTTLNLPEAHPTPKSWCHTTKEQGLAGSEAPRSTCRRPIRPQRRGAPRRRNKDSRGAKHHAQLAGGPSAPKVVVPHDEGTRVRGE